MSKQLPIHGLVICALFCAASCKEKEDASATEEKTTETATEQPGEEEVPKPDEGGEDAAMEGSIGAFVTPDTIVGEEVAYKSGGATLKGYLAYDKSVEGPRPGVLVVHEWWGHDDYARKRADMLAAMGYTAFALDMYGDGKLAKHPEDAKKFAGELMSNMDTAVTRFKAAETLLDGHDTTDAEKTAAIGYCMGGGVVLHLVRSGADLKAAASFHGTLGASEKPPAKGSVKTKLLVAHGAADPMVTADSVEAFQKEVAAAEIDMKFVAYEGAVHAFTNPAATARGEEFGIGLKYDEKADAESWKELQALLSDAFGG